MLEVAVREFIGIIINATLVSALIYILYSVLYGKRLDFKEVLIIHQTISLSYAVTALMTISFFEYVLIYLLCNLVVKLWHSIRIGESRNG